jgi:hypothetical protein
MSDPTPPGDDWQWDDIDWSEGAGESSSEPTVGDAGRKSRIGLIPGAGPGGEPGVEARSDLIRRRRVAGLVVLGVIFAAALVTPLVVFGGGGDGNAIEQTTPLTTVVQTATAPPTTTRESPATTTTTSPTTTSGTSTLHVVVPAGTSLRRGDRGSAVVSLQKGLAALGFATGEPDGVFGATTEAAVVDFQQSNNLPPDGVVGKDTVRLLNAALSAR